MGPQKGQAEKRQKVMWLLLGLGVMAIAYSSLCFYLFHRQRQLIYRPQTRLSLLPSAPDFKLTYEDVWIATPAPQTTSQGTSQAIPQAIPAAQATPTLENLSPQEPPPQAYIHSWWMPATSERYIVLPNEPVNIVSPDKVILYFHGVGGNMGDHNFLARVSAFRQLGFSVLLVDYRGFGLSKGDFPSEAQMYEDSQLVWDYLRKARQIKAEDIFIYGDSLGGAIALDLAINNPDAQALILQSTFTSMIEAIQSGWWMKLFPVQRLLTEEFTSLKKIPSLQMPVLILHGDADSVVPAEMGQQLYENAPEPKHFFSIPEADHVSIYKPGEGSYLKAIQRFVNTLPSE